VNTISKATAEILLKIKAVSLPSQKPFRYTSGILGPIYTDNRMLCSFVEERDIIRDNYLTIASQLSFDIIGGVSTGGIPHAAWIADSLKLPMVYIRSRAKGHGKGKQVQGNLPKGQKVLVIEDLISTGKSSIAAVEGIRNEGGIVNDVIAIFTYNMKKAEVAFQEANVNLHPLTNFRDLVEVATEKGYIADKDQETILEWAKDPNAWTEKMEPFAN